MESDHKQLLLHCEVCWLSRGEVISRLFELRDEVQLFLTQLQSGGKQKAEAFLQNCLNEETWPVKLAYVADIFGSLNILNLTLKRKDVHKFFIQDKVEDTIKKLERWSAKVQKNIFDPFKLLNNFLDANELEVNENTSKMIFDTFKPRMQLETILPTHRRWKTTD